MTASTGTPSTVDVGSTIKVDIRGGIITTDPATYETVAAVRTVLTAATTGCVPRATHLMTGRTGASSTAIPTLSACTSTAIPVPPPVPPRI